MNESEIAEKRVLPFLINELKWPKDLISHYGRVPVQIGANTVWADFVCYISTSGKLIPWLLVEVKKTGIPLEQAVPQAESYSLILGARYFCVMDGNKGNEPQFYATGDTQGQCIRLQRSPSLPLADYLKPRIDTLSFTSDMFNIADLFIKGLKEERKFLNDTEEHEEKLKRINEGLFGNIDVLKSKDIKEIIDKNMMIKLPNKNEALKHIDGDLDRFKNLLRFLLQFKGDIVANLDTALDKEGPYHIKGGGPFFITQLLAGAHMNEYVVLEENISKSLQFLGITGIMVKSDTAKGYVYVNDICKRIFKEILEQRLRTAGYHFGLAAVHNFLWHYYAHYREKRIWYP
jgi:hypothetical protein